MSAGPDRIVVSHDVDGWRWVYHANGRAVGQSPHAYTERAACLHGLFLVTGVRLDVPKGWRGTRAEPRVDVPRPRRAVREQTRDWHGLIASVHDWPVPRRRRRELDLP